MQQKRDPDTVSQLLTQIRELQDKVDFFSDAREFHDPESGSSSGQSHVPNQHRIMSSSMRRPSCDSGCREIHEMMSIRGNVFEDLLKDIPKNSPKIREFGDIIFNDQKGSDGKSFGGRIEPRTYEYDNTLFSQESKI